MNALDCAGVYKITCVTTGKVYVGSAARSFRRRFQDHRYNLRAGTHHTIRLQRAYNKYGADAFSFEVILICRQDDVIVYEQIVIDAVRPTLNSSPTAGSSRGVKHSVEMRARCSARMRQEYTAGRVSPLPTLQKTPEFNARLRAGKAKAWVDGKYANRKPRSVGVSRHMVRGELLTRREIAAKYGVKWKTIVWRVAHGWDGDDLILPPQGQQDGVKRASASSPLRHPA